MTWRLGEQGLEDETPQGSFERNLAVALKGREAFRERLAALGGRPLERLLAHVTSTVPYYQEYPPSLQAFETIDRSVMQAKRSLFLSAPYREIGEALSVRTNGTLSTQLRVAFDLAAHFDVNHFAFSRMNPRHTPGALGRAHARGPRDLSHQRRPGAAPLHDLHGRVGRRVDAAPPARSRRRGGPYHRSPGTRATGVDPLW